MKQWQNELQEKFGLPSIIMDSKTANNLLRRGYSNPFVQKNSIIICSYQICGKHKDYIATAGLDFVVVDEAHKLRNVHNEKAVTANNIKFAIGNYKKMLIHFLYKQRRNHGTPKSALRNQNTACPLCYLYC